MSEPREIKIGQAMEWYSDIASKRGEALPGVRIGGVGNELRVGQRIRAWSTLDGKYPQDPARMLSIDLRVTGMFQPEVDEPPYEGAQVVLVDPGKGEQTIIIPKSGILRGRHECLEFGARQPFIPSKLRFGQIVEGLSMRGERTAFRVGLMDKDTGQPFLETLLEQSPAQVQIRSIDNGNLLLVDQFRLLGQVFRDLASWATTAGDRGIDPTNALRVTTHFP